MRRTLPPFRALESFEAVARYGNVTRAAEELSRTQSAVSRQVANLEAFARRKLFLRHRKQLTLNDIGRGYYRKVVALLDELEAETVKLVTYGSDNRVLRIDVHSTFASRWLMPRVAGFSSAGDVAELQVVQSPGRVDFERQHVDAAIECSYSQPVDAISHLLLDEQVVAVIAPELHRTGKAKRFDRLRMPSRLDTWKHWIENRGPPPFTEFSLKFDDHSLLIEAACLGFGVAVVPTIYVSRELAAGQLITPFGDPIPSGRSYWLTYPESSRKKQQVVELTKWLLANRHGNARVATRR